jgi:ribonuclease PH
MSKTTTRKRTQLRPVKIEKFATQAAGSVIIKQGNTHVLCTASIASEMPRWLAGKPGEEPTQGWVTAEYNMLPASTTDRKRRGPDSRGTEIQRLIGRVLRAAVDLEKMPGLAITCDCDVLQADGGTRTASITGAYVALAQAIAFARKEGMIKTNPLIGNVAAISVGIIDGQPTLDLDYPLDVRAEVDMNIAMNSKGQFIEVQGTGEHGTFSRDELNSLLDLATKGIKQLFKVQNTFLKK